MANLEQERNKIFERIEERHKEMWNVISKNHEQIKANDRNLEKIIIDIDKMLEELKNE